MCRSTEPIDIQNINEDLQEKPVVGDKKPVLEIITRVSTTIVNGTRRRRDVHPPPPRHITPYDDDSDYDDGYDIEPYKKQGSDGMKITNVEETVMEINSPYLINALKAVVEYYPGRK